MNVRISTLLAVLALSLTAALLVGAGPAFAVPIERIETQEAEASVRALNALSNRPECFKALNPPGNRGDLNPINVLVRVPRKFPGPQPQDPTAVASVAARDFGRGTAASQINVHPPFEAFSYDPLNFDFLRFRLTRAVTLEDLQTLAILHEVGHLTGVNPKETTLPLSDLPQGVKQVGQIFNTLILVHCLGAAEYEEVNPQPLTASLGCHAHYYGIGGRRFNCQANWSGGTDPVVLLWWSIPVDATGWGHCPSGYSVAKTVTLRVTDAQGQQATVTSPTGCP